MATLEVNAINNINNFEVELPSGQLQFVYYPLCEMEGTKIIPNTHATSTNKLIPTIEQQLQLEKDKGGHYDSIVRDEKTGKLYYKTSRQSRYMTYGFDSQRQGTSSFRIKYDNGVDTDGVMLLLNESSSEKNHPLGELTLRQKLESDNIYAYNLSYSSSQSFENLSISRLMIIVTLKRAEQVEADLIEQMDMLTTSNAKLDTLSEIADLIVETKTANNDATIASDTKIHYKGVETTIDKFFKDVLGEPANSTIPNTCDELMELVKHHQDDLNNVSQETMINIQKLVSARDQSYLLGSVSTKLLMNGNVMIARNF